MKMFKLMFALAMIFMVLMTAAVCFAADVAPAAASSPFGDALAAFCTNTLLPIFGALALGFASWAAKKFGDKFKIQGLADSNGFLMQLAGQGVAFAEEKAANFAKNAQPITGNDKLNAAIAYMLQNSPHVTEAQAQSLVTAALASLPGVGATGAATVAAVPVVAPVVGADPERVTAAPADAAPVIFGSSPLAVAP